MNIKIYFKIERIIEVMDWLIPKRFRTMGYYDRRCNHIHINMKSIIKVKEEFDRKNIGTIMRFDWDNYFSHIISHEIIHAILNNYIDDVACIKFDKLCKKLMRIKGSGL